MLQNSLFVRWNNSDRTADNEIDEFIGHLLEAYEIGNERQQEGLKYSFPEIFDNPQFELTPKNIEKFTFWVSASQRDVEMIGCERGNFVDSYEDLTPDYLIEQFNQSYKYSAHFDNDNGTDNIVIVRYSFFS